MIPPPKKLDFPLADVHRHLDGSLRRRTLDELADKLGLRVPEPLAFTPSMGIQACLDRFRFTLSLLQEPETVTRVAAEICEDAAEEGVDALEVRFAPQLHRGASPEAIIDAALEGIAGRAGLTLCALYGEPPTVLMDLLEAARTRPGVVGIDLAGGPAADHSWRMEDYADPFAEAERIGLGRTVHAAEGRPAREIATAVTALRAQRIGHGTTLLEDPETLSMVVDREIVIEACVTSNVHTGAIESMSDHPLPRWMERGVQVCICTDNTLFSEVDAPEEYRRVARNLRLTDAQLRTLAETGRAAAFNRR